MLPSGNNMIISQRHLSFNIIFSRSGRDFFLIYSANFCVKTSYHVISDMKSVFREACPDNQNPVYSLNEKVSH